MFQRIAYCIKKHRHKSTICRFYTMPLILPFGEIPSQKSICWICAPASAQNVGVSPTGAWRKIGRCWGCSSNTRQSHGGVEENTSSLCEFQEHQSVPRGRGGKVGGKRLLWCGRVSPTGAWRKRIRYQTYKYSECQSHGGVEENYYNGVATIHRGSVPRASGGKGALKFQGTYTDVSPTGAWMAKNQLGRRNVTPLQASYLRGFRYISEVKDVGVQEGVVNNARGSNQYVKNVEDKGENFSPLSKKATDSKKLRTRLDLKLA